MQRYYNAIYIQKVSDFENSEFHADGLCFGGIMINKTSAGTEICRGYMAYAPKVFGKGEIAFHKQNCYFR